MDLHDLFVQQAGNVAQQSCFAGAAGVVAGIGMDMGVVALDVTVLMQRLASVQSFVNKDCFTGACRQYIDWKTFTCGR